MMADHEVREQVRERYAAAAVAVRTGSEASCCGPVEGEGSCCAPASAATQAAGAVALELNESFGAGLYGAETGDLPAEAVLASLGCGNPLAVADLRPGEQVLDLGSGGGIDVLLSARRVGPTGHAYGLDMTVEMLGWRAPTRRRPARTTLSSSKAPSRRSRCPTRRSMW